MRKRIRKITLWLAPVVLTVLALCAYHWRMHRALLQYEAELRARGERLTWAELDVHPSTKAEDVQFRRDFASNSFLKPDHSPVLAAWIAPGVARVSWQQDTHWEWDSGQQDSILLTNWEDMEREADDTADALATFRAILKHPGADFGPHTNTPVYFEPDFDERKLSWLARGFTEAIAADLHRKNQTAVVSNLVAMIEIVNVNRDEPPALGFRVSFAQTALATTWEWLQAAGWSDQQLSNVQSLWERTELTGSMPRWLIRNRVATKEAATLITQADASNRVSLLLPMQVDAESRPWALALLRDVVVPAYMAFEFDSDILFSLEYQQNELETVRRFGAGVAWPSIRKTMEENKRVTNAWLYDRAEYRFWLSRTLMRFDRFPKFFGKVVETETERRMAVVAIALRRYQNAHKEYPTNLDLLVPQYLEKVPLDPMTAKELSYRLKPDGAFLLYSAGRDGHDDGGDPTPIATSNPPSLWDGRDAVWPAPATAAQIAAEQARLATNKPEFD